MQFNKFSYFYFIFTPIFIIFFNLSCNGDLKPTLPLSVNKIKFSGKILSPPKQLDRDRFKLEIRFYNCPDTFGKKNAGTGTYPFKKGDCRKSYTKYEFLSDKYDYSQEVQTPIAWTHATIYLLETDLISGMYSPGENPFWFTARSGTEFTHNFDFESTENPIPDAEQYRLAEKFSPLIALKKDKKYLPTNLEKFNKKFTIQTYKGKNPDSELYEILDREKDNYFELDEKSYGGNTNLYFHVRPADTFVSGTSPNALPGWRDNRNYRYSKAKGDIVVSFYLWYDYNEGPSGMGNKHEGDFESFAILTDASGNPKRFMTTGHDHVMLDTEWKNINSIDHHPIIFIAHGNKGVDGGNPTSPYGGYETSLEAGNFLFNALANPKDIFPDISESQLIVPKSVNREKLRNLRIGPGEWIDKDKTRYLDVTKQISREIHSLIKWEEPAWIGKPAVNDPDKNHSIPDESVFFQNFSGRLGRHPRTNINFFTFTQYGRSPVNPPFKMNEEQHFTYEKPKEDRCEKVRKGDYCPKFKGDEKTPQF